jgi:hypothetical protein
MAKKRSAPKKNSTEKDSNKNKEKAPKIINKGKEASANNGKTSQNSKPKPLKDVCSET